MDAHVIVMVMVVVMMVMVMVVKVMVVVKVMEVARVTVMVYFESCAQRDGSEFVEFFDEGDVPQWSQHRSELSAFHRCMLSRH